MSRLSAFINFRTLAYILIGLVFALFINSTIQAIKWVDKPFPRFLLYHNLIVSQVSLPRWSEEDKPNIKSYEKIIEINGMQVKRADEVYDIVARKPAGTPINYTVSRNNRHQQVTVRSLTFTASDLLNIHGIQSFIGLILLIAGSVVYFLKPTLLASKIYLIFCLSIAIWFISDFDYQSTYSIAYSVNLAYLAQIFNPAFLIFLAMVFPTEKTLYKKHTYVILAPLSLSAILYISQSAFGSYPEIWKQIDIVVWLYVVSGTIIFVLSTAYSYFRPNSPLGKQRAQVVLLGAFFGFFLPALAAFFFIYFGYTNINYLSVPVLLFPISIAYAISKHKLFDIDIIIRKTIVYATLTGVVGCGVVLLVVGFNLIFARYGGWQNPGFFIVLTIILILTLNPLKNRIQGLIDRTFFRRNYDYRRTLEEISSAMVSLLDLDEISNRIIRTIEQSLFSTSVSVILYDHRREAYTLYATSGNSDETDDSLSIEEGSQLVRFLQTFRDPIFIEDLITEGKFREHSQEISQTFEDLNASLVIPMFFKKDLIGMLAIGEKKSGLLYGSQDINLLQALANQSAVATQNAQAYKLVEDYAKRLEDANKELKETQDRLVQAEKMSAVGQLAAGIAHEIRNPLNIIEGARYYLDQIAANENAVERQEYLNYIKDQVDRTNHLINSLLKFSKPESADFRQVDINQIIEESLVLLTKQIADNRVNLVKNLNTELPEVTADPNQLWHVFINILMNALQAMPDGGELIIETRFSVGDRSRVAVEFKDTGIGINSEDLSKIFDPFYTKKAAGTGLGLSVSYRIVEEHGGMIKVKSETSSGSTFTVELPVSRTEEWMKRENAYGTKKSVSGR